MSNRPIQTDAAPAAIGPYSQAVEADLGSIVFLSGQIPLIPETGELLEGDVTAQTEQVMKNLKAVLLAAGCDWTDVVRATIFLADMDDFAAVNAVYEAHLGGHKPARACVQVSRLPKSVDVEIDAIAVKGR